MILDADEVPEYELAFHHVGLPVQVNRPDRDFDIAGDGVIGNHYTEVGIMTMSGKHVADEYQGIPANARITILLYITSV
jgi:hypothetical protein